MADRRTYQDSCGIARALDRVGERWALLVVRELVNGPKRFTDLRTGLPRVGPDMLAQRLRELEADGVVRRRELPAPAASRVYELTAWGAELLHVLVALGRWGSRAPLPADPPALGIEAAIVALETTFDSAAAASDRSAPLVCGLALGDQDFTLRVADGSLTVGRGADPAADATLRTDTRTLAAVLWHGRPPADAELAGECVVDGDHRVIERLTSLFRAPVPAPGL